MVGASGQPGWGHSPAPASAGGWQRRQLQRAVRRATGCRSAGRASNTHHPIDSTAFLSVPCLYFTAHEGQSDTKLTADLISELRFPAQMMGRKASAAGSGPSGGTAPR